MLTTFRWCASVVFAVWASCVHLAPASAAGVAGTGLPWAVIDKTRAELRVFHADGALAGQTHVLLGADLGDHSVAGVGERTQSGLLRPGDRTTPSGRFVSRPGYNDHGEAVVWVDYDAAFAIHRLRPGPLQASRQERLGSADPLRRRVSAGCVVVPEVFFDRVVAPLLGRGPAIVVILPEKTSTRLPS